jgi:DNA-binding response OmpR family regulator
MFYLPGHQFSTKKEPISTILGTFRHLDFHFDVIELVCFSRCAMKRAVVLFVEKDRSSAVEAVQALRQAGYKVVEATDPAMGLKMIYEVRPDVVIASADLPPVKGEDAFMRLRQASYLPLIAIGSRDDVVEMLELGADAFLAGPPSAREVVARVGSLLKRRGDDDPAGGQIRQPIGQ